MLKLVKERLFVAFFIQITFSWQCLLILFKILPRPFGFDSYVHLIAKKTATIIFSSFVLNYPSIQKIRFIVINYRWKFFQGLEDFEAMFVQRSNQIAKKKKNESSELFKDIEQNRKPQLSLHFLNFDVFLVRLSKRFEWFEAIFGQRSSYNKYKKKSKSFKTCKERKKQKPPLVVFSRNKLSLVLKDRCYMKFVSVKIKNSANVGIYRLCCYFRGNLKLKFHRTQILSICY